MSDAVQEAVRLEEAKPVETELDADNREYQRMKKTLLAEHKGRYAVFHSGRFA
ncbi:MAG: hypothetical protein RMH74_02665 [Candidatus Caldarchaeum sp.]|nr:hypothetical protein [Candidatus Caldarchaeum sp.]